MAISHCYWCLVVKNGNFTLLLMSSGQEWKLADLPQDLPADLPPKCIMGYILWDRFWQPFWILQEKVGISCYFWIIWVVNSQLAMYRHLRYNPSQHPLKPPQNTPQMTRDFNSDRWYLPWIPVHKTWQMKILWQMDPLGIKHRCLEYCYTKLGRQTYFGWWTPHIIENRCLEYCYTKLGRWTFFGQCTPSVPEQRWTCIPLHKTFTY